MPALSDSPELQLSCFYNSTPDVLTSVLKNQCDLCICIKQSGTSLRNRCQAANISYTVLAHIPLCVQLSRSHPLLQEPDFDFTKLADYPFTVFSDPDSPSVTQYTFPFINANKLIRVHSSTSRRDIVAHTNAFSIVLQHSQEYNDRYGLVNIPLPDYVCELAYLHSANRTLPPLALEYLELLKCRLAFLQPSE